MLAHDTVELNGIQLHYAHEGKGPLFLFLHGFPEFWYEWRDLLPEFARDHLAVAPDLRGFNLSSRPAEVEQYKMRLLVEDVRALVTHLGYEKFTLAAHDWGGAVAWSFALAYPQMLDHLIIINSPHPALFRRELTSNPAQQKASQYMQFFRTPEAEARIAADNFALLRGPLFGGAFIRNADDKQAYLAAWSQPGALTGGLNYYRATQPNAGDAPDPARFVVKVPTLVIWGEKDTALLTGLLDGLETFVPNLTLKRIPDGTHWVLHEQPQVIIQTIREFLAKA